MKTTLGIAVLCALTVFNLAFASPPISLSCPCEVTQVNQTLFRADFGIVFDNKTDETYPTRGLITLAEGPRKSGVIIGRSSDNDLDGIGDNSDPDDDNDTFTDADEVAAGTDPLSASSCPGCFSFDIDDDGEAKALTDGLLVIRHLFGFSGEALTAGAVGSDAKRSTPADIAAYLTNAATELDIDGDDEAKALTDGLLLIRYLFGFSGDSLTSGAVGEGATRATFRQRDRFRLCR